VYASNSEVSADINIIGNSAEIYINGISNDIYSAELSITFKNKELECNYEPADKKTFSYAKQDTLETGTKLTVYIDSKDRPISNRGNINVGTIKFSGKPEFNNICLILLNEKAFAEYIQDISVNITNSSVSEGSSSLRGNGGSSKRKNEMSTSASETEKESKEIENTSENTTDNISENKEDNKNKEDIFLDSSYTNIFNDIKNHWAEKAVNDLYKKGIVNGMLDGTFQPDKNVTRAEFITMTANFDKFITNTNLSFSGDSKFSDVKSDSWFAPYVVWGEKNGIINGMDEEHFAPNSNITREQMAVIIYNYCKYKKYNFLDDISSDFADNNMISNYAKEAVMKIRAENIINGKNNNMFAPKELATRAESSMIIYKLLYNF